MRAMRAHSCLHAQVGGGGGGGKFIQEEEEKATTEEEEEGVGGICTYDMHMVCSRFVFHISGI